MTDATRIERPASQPDADLACEFEIALTEVGLRERLESRVVRSPSKLADGLEMAFETAAWDDVQRYIDTESRCCPFLSLEAKRTPNEVILRVTGRADARELIYEMFGVRDGAQS